MTHPRVVYIVGNGRSGSTLLSFILSSCECTANSGELSTVHVARECDLVCSCGCDINQCQFWRAVVNRYEHISGDKGLRLFRKLNHVYDKNFRSISRLETSMYTKYVHLNSSMYRAISEVTDSDVVVDISKSWSRALMLYKNPHISTRYIHLIRDPRSIIWSLVPKNNGVRDIGKSYFSEVSLTRYIWKLTSWLSQNYTIDLFLSALLQSRILKVRFEDLLTDPCNTLQNICNFVDLPYDRISKNTNNFQDIHVSHYFSGNPSLANKDSIEIESLRKHEKWRDETSFYLKFLTSFLALPYSYIHGYCS